MAEFNQCLLEIGTQLSTDRGEDVSVDSDLDYLTFLCEWEMPEAAGKIEQVKLGHQLFGILQERGKISPENFSFLARILNAIGRDTLTKSFYSARVFDATSPAFEPTSRYLFAECLVNLAQSLKESDRKELIFLLRWRLQVPKDRIPTPTKLFLELNKQLSLTETNTKILCDALEQIKRRDLIMKLNEFLINTGQQPHHIETDEGVTHSLHNMDAELMSKAHNDDLPSCGESTAQVHDLGQRDNVGSDITASGSATAITTTMQGEVAESIKKLEEEFFILTNSVEDILMKEEVDVQVLVRRFRSLPLSMRRQQQSDGNFSAIRQKVIRSKTIRELFDNLTELKHWSYMTPAILTYIIQDVKRVHFNVAVYESKLSSFKENTKLKDIIGLEFLIPDYYVELKVKVKDLWWLEKTICSAEKSINNLLAKAEYRSAELIGGWQSVKPGCIELMLVLLQSVKISAFSKKESYDAFKSEGVISITVDENTVSYEEHIETPSGPELWSDTGLLVYAAQGNRDVLIIEADIPLDDPTASHVARIPYSLTEDDRQKLKSQRVSHDDLSETVIIEARYELDSRRTLAGVLKSKPERQLSQEGIMKTINNLFTTTKKKGVIVYYIGAGRRNTGDWCFEDGFITFRDIAQLYLQSKLRGRVLTIVSDCSYSGRWVRDCMEFLDEQGVQPCGHKAREKGILIKVYASCRPMQIPMQYQFSLHGTANDKNSGEMFSYTSKQLLEEQHTYSLNSSVIQCATDKKIEDECELPSHFTWQDWKINERLCWFVDKASYSRPMWQYVLLRDNEREICEFRNKKERSILTGSHMQVHATDYEQILESGWGIEPPNEVKIRMESCTHLLTLAQSLKERVGLRS